MSHAVISQPPRPPAPTPLFGAPPSHIPTPPRPPLMMGGPPPQLLPPHMRVSCECASWHDLVLPECMLIATYNCVAPYSSPFLCSLALQWGMEG